MPVISTFFGIIIRMFYLDHEPPHFHVEYQGESATFDFSGRLLAGHLRSPRIRRLVREWAQLHEFELRTNWKRVKAQRPLHQIAPLE